MKIVRSSLARAFAPGSFVRGVAVISGGTALGQGIVLLASPLVTRLYTPEMFGTYTVYVAFLSVAVVVAALRYPLAIPLPEDHDDGLALVLVSFAALLLSTAAMTAVALGPGGTLLTMLDVEVLATNLWLLPVGLAGAGTYQILSYWAIRRSEFSRLGMTKITQGIGLTLTQIVLGMTQAGVVGLVWGDVVGRVAGSGSLLRMTLRDVTWRRQSLRRCSANAVRYVRFPLLSSSSSLLNAAALHLPAIMLLGIYGPAVAGWFALAQRVVATPMSLVGTAIGQVYMGALAEARRGAPHELLPLLRATSLRLLMIGFGPALALAMAGPWVFATIFGSAWEPAGVYARALSVSFLVQFATGPVSQTLNVLERQDIQFWWDAGRFVLVLATLLIARRQGLAAVDAVFALGVVMAVTYAVLLALSFMAVRRLGGIV